MSLSISAPHLNLPSACLIGTSGYARVHLDHLLDLERRGELRLPWVVSPPATRTDEVLKALAGSKATILADFSELLSVLSESPVDMAVVPTPIHLHASMTTALLKLGVNVLVEKPLCASLEEVEQIMEGVRQSQRKVAVGYQYLHAPEIRELKRRLDRGEIGKVRRLVVHGSWPRGHGYYARNDWAGRLTVDGAPVLDSPVNNAMSHFFMLMLYLAGEAEGTAATPVRMAAELYRAQNIESFDTAAIRLELSEGCRLDFFGTHSGEHIVRPTISIEGTEGHAHWEQDHHARLQGRAGCWEQMAFPESDTRERMLRDVLGVVQGERRFVCTPDLAAAHVECVTRLHRMVPVVSLAPEYLKVETTEEGTFTSVPGLNEIMERACLAGCSLSEAGAHWATPLSSWLSL